MMEALINFTCAHAHSAHWIIFLLLLLAGLNVPISEDLLLLTGGVIASTCIPDETFHLFAWIYAGCWISAWEAYWIGRHFGPRLYQISWFQRILTPKKIVRLHHYYEKFGVFTFMLGRFIPGGVRNALFITAGLGKMPFLKFILRDGFAALISASTIFYIGFSFGRNHETIARFVHTYQNIVIAIICLFIIGGCSLYFWQKSKPETLV